MFKSVKGKSITDRMIKDYIDYLIDSFPISEASRYNIKGKKYIGSPSKYYFEAVEQNTLIKWALQRRFVFLNCQRWVYSSFEKES